MLIDFMVTYAIYIKKVIIETLILQLQIFVSLSVTETKLAFKCNHW